MPGLDYVVHIIKLLVMEEWVTGIMDDGYTADIVLLDSAKAFDSVNYRLLLLKIHAYGLCPWSCGLVLS